jgi:transcriptional regulator with XRE-family HTH domain
LTKQVEFLNRCCAFGAGLESNLLGETRQILFRQYRPKADILYLSGVESSERNVSIDNIARIAKGLRVEAWTFLKDGVVERGESARILMRRGCFRDCARVLHNFGPNVQAVPIPALAHGNGPFTTGC